MNLKYLLVTRCKDKGCPQTLRLFGVSSIDEINVKLYLVASFFGIVNEE